MEDKKIKTPVYTMEQIFSDSAEIPVDIDFTLPDFCPDVNKILKCRSVPCIASKSVSGNSITVDGAVTITVIYADCDNRLFSYEYQYPFNKSFDAGVDADGAVLRAKVKNEYINCRAVTGRKIDIHGAVGVYVSLCRRKCTEVISDIDVSGIEMLRGVAPATSPMGNAEKYLIVDEEIELGQGKPPIRAVLRYDSAVAVKECKLINNKAMVKGELVLKILYCTEDGDTQTLTDTEPFSQLLEIDGITDSCECDASVYIANIELKPRVGASGDARSFTLSAKILVCCECYCNNDIDIILDAYSRKFDADIKRNDVCFNKICYNINEIFSCKKSVDLPDNNVSSVADMWCEAKTTAVKCENGELVIKGSVMNSFILISADGEPSFFEKPIDFEYKTPVDIKPDCMRCDPQITAVSSGYTITGGTAIEIRIELCVNAAVYRCENMSLITDLDVNEDKTVAKKDRGAMTIYFASDGEKVWDIAHRYLASVDEIRQINDIDEDVLENGKMILVPMN